MMIKKGKPILEKISPEFGSSFTIKQFFKGSPTTNEPFWHFHPELEIVYVNGGNGKRHIGNHLSYYNDGDLIFIGSNLPHYGFTDQLTANESETVVQVAPDFLGDPFFQVPEMQLVHQFFARAKGGISFYGKTKEEIGVRLEKLTQKDGFERLMELLNIFQDMAKSEEYKILNAEGVLMEFETQDNDRAKVIYHYVQQHFHRRISLEEIAAKVNMTVPGFCRYFKKLSRKTFTQMVNEFRVVHACKMLVEEESSITDVAFESGFNNFSHFSRLFREITGKTPSEYRKTFKKILQ